MRFSRAFVLILRGFFRRIVQRWRPIFSSSIRVTRGVLADEVVGVLDRMATSALSANVVQSL